MNRIRTARFLALAGLAVAAHAADLRAQQLPPAHQVVDRYVQAIGGRAALARLNSRHMVGETSAAGETIQFESFNARPQKMVLVMKMNGGTITTGYDGQTAWQRSSNGGPRLVTERMELRQILDNAQFDRNLDPAVSSATMTTVGERTVEGRACWEVKTVSPHGVEATSCFDKETGLLIGRRSREGSEIGEIDVDAVISGYRDFDGVKMPTRIVTTLMGQQMVTTFTSVSHAPIHASKFDLPAEIRALRP